MKRLILALALVLGLVPFAQAQISRGVVDYVLAEDWDLDATTYTAPYFTNVAGYITEPGTQIPRCITTVGSTTTTTALTTGQSPFAQAAVGDEITVVPGSTAGGNASSLPMVRYVSAKASADSITVGPTAWDLSVTPGGNGCSAGYTYRLKKFQSSTSAGWIPSQGMSLVTFLLGVDQINTTTGIDYKVECRHRGNGVPDVIFIEKATTILTTAGTVKVDITSPYDDCRLMVRMTSTDDGADIGAAQEKLNISMHGVIRN